MIDKNTQKLPWKHISCPSLSYFQDYRLDFNHFSKRWKGAAATIVEDPGNYVYGVLWELANDDMPNLDKYVINNISLSRCFVYISVIICRERVQLPWGFTLSERNREFYHIQFLEKLLKRPVTRYKECAGSSLLGAPSRIIFCHLIFSLLSLPWLIKW